ncbi:MAG: hypothetical protein EBR27_12550, partial [Betaproteobacteria bacterium]|nr:hypothetical protein [Betaproteobacteria bacterium]
MTLKTKEELAASIYFVVGHGTEGGSASYKISVAGVLESKWLKAQDRDDPKPIESATVSQNSGYTIGAMQFDLGQRWSLKLGSTTAKAAPGEQNYVDAVLDQVATYATKNDLTNFPSDTSALRAALITHGNGLAGRSTITFIDPDVRDAINAWTGSDEGRKWIHKNLDLPLATEAASKAYDVVQKYGSAWTDDEKNLAALELAKVQNQIGNVRVDGKGAALSALKNFNEDSTFEDFKRVVNGLGDAKKALEVGEVYQKASESGMSSWLDVAQKKILESDFDPAKLNSDPDLKLALRLTQSNGVTVEDAQLSVKVRGNTYRYAMSDDNSTVNLDIVKGAGTDKETVVGGECFNNQAVLNGHGLARKPATSPNPTAPSGHWEDTTQYDQEGNVISSEGRIWVSDVPSMANQTGTKNGSSTSTAAPTNHTSSGALYLSRDGTSAILPDGTLVNAGSGGHLKLNSQGGLVVTRSASDYGDAEGTVNQVTTYSAAGKVIDSVLQQLLPGQSAPLIQGQERTLTYTTEDGTTNTVTARFQVGVGWVDSGTGESVLRIQDIIANLQIGTSETPIQWHAPVTATTAQDTTPTTTETTQGEPTSTEHVAFRQVEMDGKTYTITPKDTMERPVPGNPGWVELRDSTGGGVILDGEGAVIAQLQSGDRVGMMDDGRITVNDSNGRYVNRIIDEAQADVFYQAPAQATTTESSSGHSASNQPVAPVPSSPPAPETIAHANPAELAPQAALEEAQFNAAANNAAGALSLISSLANLQHFDKLTDLGKLQSLVGLYNQFDKLGSATAQLSGGTGGNLPGNLGQWGAGLSLVTALKGNDPIAQASAAGAFYNSFGSASNNIPLPYLQALNLITAIESGNTVSMVASAVAFIPGWGTAASIAISIIAPLFADKPPPPEGATHYEWDAQGNIQIKLDFNQS